VHLSLSQGCGTGGGAEPCGENSWYQAEPSPTCPQGPGYGRDEDARGWKKCKFRGLVSLDLGLALHLYRISVGAFEAHLLREGGAGRPKALFGFAHLVQ
jgi:hypothetical protein